MLKDRSCGVLLHITSLPSQYGIGDLGPEAYKFADFLSASKIRYWQILPLNPTNLQTGNSPYSSESAFAGNTLLISPELLITQGLIDRSDLISMNNSDNYEIILANRISLLKKAYTRFQRNEEAAIVFKEFKNKNNYWLNDYSLYRVLKTKFNQPWVEWPLEFRNRSRDVINKINREETLQLEEEKYFQFVFFNQWFRLKEYCNQRNISIIGDIPYYVSHDSADVWAHSQNFKLDKNKNPAFISGVPPDYFSESGQLWGNPVYNWKTLKKCGFEWWLRRIKHNFRWADILRLDHFRAFSAYWEIPAAEKTAITGKWIMVPGEEFFSRLKLTNRRLRIIAEDLGDIDEPVKDLIAKFKFPGMKVLQFGFDSKIKNSPDAPHRHIKNCVVYTGTHDNLTTRSWFEKAGKYDREKLNNYLGKKINERTVSENFIRMAMMSVAQLCVIPMQDFLNLGDEGTMNRPGTSTGNWRWRLNKNQLTQALQKYISHFVEIYERA